MKIVNPMGGHGLYVMGHMPHRKFCTKCHQEVRCLRGNLVWYCLKCRAVIVNENLVKVVRRIKLEAEG